jgi:Ca2+-binding EF-hand superfamily protein
MNKRTPLAALAATLALVAFTGAARAETMDDNSFTGMFKMERMDKNKDGMVSKAEFIEMMGKVWDMKAKEMKLKADKASAKEMEQILMYLRAGG